jgi:hypothetical protein
VARRAAREKRRGGESGRKSETGRGERSLTFEGKGSTFERITVHFFRGSDMTNIERMLIFDGKPINF